MESDLSGNGVSLSSDGSIVAISAPWNDVNGNDSGHVRVYLTSTPTVPSGMSITGSDYGDSEIYLEGSATSDGNATIIRYDAACTDGVTTITESSTTSKIIVTGLTNDTAYTCTVTATNSVGTSDASSSTTAITPLANTNTIPIWLQYLASTAIRRPDNPSITNTSAGDTEIEVTFSAPVNNGGSAITSYEVTCTDGTATFSSSASSSPIRVTGLTNGIAYTCTVTATNSVGTSSVSTASVSTIPIAAIQGLPVWMLYEASK